MTHSFGIDFGGSGIKGAPVDLEIGDFAAERVRIATPQPATPRAVAEVFRELVDRFPEQDSDDAVGVTVPGVVRRGVVGSAANIDKSWIDLEADALFSEVLEREVHVVNDADAAGLAEVRYGAAAGQNGLVIVTTLGTGIGSALVMDGRLVPNSELGHLEVEGHPDVERWAASSIRKKEDLSYPEWAERLTVYYRTLERLFSPELFVVGGGVSRDSDQFLHLIDVKTPIVAAALRNRAGIVGAALWAEETER
jgi:polyphosphate glucokinase